MTNQELLNLVKETRENFEKCATDGLFSDGAKAGLDLAITIMEAAISIDKENSDD